MDGNVFWVEVGLEQSNLEEKKEIHYLILAMVGVDW
jgi:hypothetical protein